MKYLLDKNVHVRFEKLQDSDLLSDDGKFLLKKFFNNNVSERIPKALFAEYFRSDYANFRSLMSTCTKSCDGIMIQQDNDDRRSYVGLEFSYRTEEDRKCKDIIIQDCGKVHAADLEAITYCIKNDLVFVTNDKPAAKICLALGVETIDFEEFIKKAKISKYLSEKI